MDRDESCQEGEDGSDGAKLVVPRHLALLALDGDYAMRTRTHVSQAKLSLSVAAPRLDGKEAAHLGPGAHELNARLITHIRSQPNTRLSEVKKEGWSEERLQN